MVWSLITAREEGATGGGGGGGGGMWNFTPTKRGGETSFSHAEGGWGGAEVLG